MRDDSAVRFDGAAIKPFDAIAAPWSLKQAHADPLTANSWIPDTMAIVRRRLLRSRADRPRARALIPSHCPLSQLEIGMHRRRFCSLRLPLRVYAFSFAGQ